MKKGFSLGLFLVLDFIILLTAFNFFALLEGKGIKANNGDVLGATVQATYAAVPEAPLEGDAEIISSDARSEIINNFLAHYKSPMGTIGEIVVKTADAHGLPFWLVPAIAQCESNLGKRVPPGSNNAWGWGIYGEKVTKFDSWEKGVEKVSEGLGKNYLGAGLNTPEEIMKRYTPSSNGSWAACVNQFLLELK